MEEKKSIKISLSTFFLILAIIVIIIMGYFIYKFYNDKENANNQVVTLNNQVNKLEGTVNSLQETVDNISNLNTITSSTNSPINNTTINETNTTSTKLSQKEAEKILEEKFKVAEKIWLDSENIFTKTNNNEIVNFDKTILNYGTQNFLNEAKKNLPWGVRNENDKYYQVECGGARGYAGFDCFENIKITNTTITATLKTKQSTYDDSINDWISTADKTSEFKLIKNGDNWLIDEFNSSDLD